MYASMPNTAPDHAVKRIEVVAAIIADQQGNLLISLRPEHLHQGGLWEFPGGKIEAGETAQQALRREIAEELGIEVVDASLFQQLEFDYPDKSVALSFWRVERFSGSPESLEGQEIRWITPQQLREFQFPAANQPIVERLLAEAAARP